MSKRTTSLRSPVVCADVVERADLVWTQWVSRAPELFKTPSRKSRDAFHHRLREIYREDGVLVDLGGGLSVTNGLVAQLGMRVYVFDFFRYDLGWMRASQNVDYGKIKDFLAAAGVTFVDCDLCSCDLRKHFEVSSVDAVTSHHCLEHLHQSPRGVLESALTVLKPGAVMLLEVPNAINALKRFDVLRGVTNYQSYAEYYESEDFTGHVREYSIADLKELRGYLRIPEAEIYGRNWYGTLYDRLGYGMLGRTADRILSIFPGLCGSLYLRAIKTD